MFHHSELGTAIRSDTTAQGNNNEKPSYAAVGDWLAKGFHATCKSYIFERSIASNIQLTISSKDFDYL